MERSESSVVLSHVTQLVRSLLPASEASLILWDADGERFSVSSSTIAEQPPQYAERRVRQEGGASRWIVDHQEAVVVEDVEDDPFTAAKILREGSFRAYLGVPIVFEGESLGVLYALDRETRAYGSDDVDFMNILARRAANAIGLARLFEQVNELASTDDLTGLANRREFMARATAELERDRRSDRGLAIVVFDVDEFKQVNDVHGHGVGDEVLVQIARRCTTVVRAIDVVARIGGEEFAVLIPEADADRAAAVGERLRAIVESDPMLTSAGPVRVTITIGVAARNAADADLTSLLRRADRALYDGKEQGRNRVIVAD
ncbi:MAG: sensor domain-containing diguanylate cyclase [Ilumatobacter sp.]|nr:sensor domain-containing diguanylate cyclase [Ilumatobacter sp.]